MPALRGVYALLRGARTFAGEARLVGVPSLGAGSLVRVLDAMPRGTDAPLLPVRASLRAFTGSFEQATVRELVAFDYGPALTAQTAALFTRALEQGQRLDADDGALMLGFFLRTNNVRAANTVLRALVWQQVPVPTAALNWYLRFLGARVLRSRKAFYPLDPLAYVVRQLTEFRRLRVPVNEATWNAALLCVPTHAGRAEFIDAMQQRGVGLLEETRRRLVPSVVGARSVYAPHVLRALTPSSALLERWVRVRLQRLGARAFAETLRLGLQQPSAPMLHVFLSKFMGYGRLDYQLAILDLFNVALDAKAFVYLLRTACVDRREQLPIVFTLVEQVHREGLILPRKGRVVFRRALRSARELGIEPREYGQLGWLRLRKALKWTLPAPANAHSSGSQPVPDRLSKLAADAVSPVSTEIDLKHAEPSLLKALGYAREGEDLPQFRVSSLGAGGEVPNLGKAL